MAPAVEDYIPRRALDWTFLVYYVFQIVSTLGLDMQATLPACLYPSWMRWFHTHHIDTWKDPWLANTWKHPWYFSICMWEYFLHVPFYFLAARAYYTRIYSAADRCSWIRIPVLLYCTQTMTAVSAVMLMALMGDFSDSQVPAPSGPVERLKLAGMYGSFFILCLLNFMDALTGRDYLPSATSPPPPPPQAQPQPDHQHGE
ncbi:sigma intracellular receptor 2-like isoform X2 [Babylonia areolata]